MGWDSAPPTAAELKAAKPAAWDATPPTDAELKAASPGLASRALGALKSGAEYVGEKYGSYVTGPARAAIAEELSKGIEGRPLSAFIEQMGKPSETAPSGQSIAQQLGVPNQDYGLHSKRPAENDPDFFRFNNEPLFAQEYAKTGKGSDYTINPSKDIGAVIEAGADPILLGAGPIKALRGLRVFEGVNPVPGLTGLAGKVVGKGLDVTAGGADWLAGSDKATAALNSAVHTKEAVKAGADAVFQSLKGMFNPHIAEDYPRFKAIAEKNGLDPNLLPESVEFGQGSTIDKMAAGKREMGGPTQKQFQHAVDSVHDAHDQALTK